MPTFLENLRMRNIFGLPPGGMVGNDLPSQGGITGNQPIPSDPFGSMKPSPYEGIFGNGMDMEEMELTNPATSISPVGGSSGNGMEDIATRMASMYTPETQATDRFNQMIESMPQRNNPGMLRKILSIAAGTLGGPQAFDMSMYGNYNNKMRDWKEGLDPAYKAATLERQSNVNERTLAVQTIANQLREDALRHKEQNDERKATIAQQRADVYEFKAKNPTLRLIMTKGGNVMAFNPVTSEVADTGIPTGSLTDADRLALEQGNQLERISARGDVQSDLSAQGHEQRLDEIAASGAEARTTKGTPSAAAGGKDELPTQTRVRQFNAARELSNSRPDLAKFITIGNPGSSDFEIAAPSTNFFGNPIGPTQEQYNEINNHIYGGARPTTVTPPVTPTQTPPARSGGAGPRGGAPAPPVKDSALTPTNQKRNKAIELLKQNKKPVTEANIAYVMKQIKD